MATRRTTSKLTKTALAAINAASAPPKRSPAGAAYTLSRSRSLSGSASGLRNSVNSLTGPLLREANVLASASAGAVKLRGVIGFDSRGFGSSSPAYSTAASASQTNPSEFIEMAWEGIVGAVDAAQVCKQQVVETEHLMKALLEQKDGLARRILTKAGLDNTSVLQAVDDFISQQPKVLGDTSGPIMGSHLASLLDNARKYKKEMGDDFVSVEHLLLAFHSDKRFGQQLFRNLQLSEKDLREAIRAVRGNQRKRIKTRKGNMKHSRNMAMT